MKLSNQKSIFFLLLIIIFISRLFLSESNLNFNSTDSVNYHKAITHFSIAHDRPHLPGYPLYTFLAKFINIFTNNNFFSIVLLSCLFTCLAYFLYFHLFKSQLSANGNFLILIFIFSNPFIWYYGSISENYAFDLIIFPSILLIDRLKNGKYYLLPILSIIAGIRLSSAIMIFPLVAYLIYFGFKNSSVNWKKFTLISLIPSVLIIISLLFVVLNNVGGIENYLNYWHTNNPTKARTILSNAGAIITVGFYPFLFLFVYILITFCFYSKTIKLNTGINLKILLISIIPSMIIFAFYHYSKGYLTISLVSIIILVISYRFNKTALIIVSVIQIIFYSFFPYTTYQIETHFRENKRELAVSKLFINRILGPHLPCYSNILYRDKIKNDFINAINFVQDTNSMIMIDPSSIINCEMASVLFKSRIFLEPTKIKLSMLKDLEKSKILFDNEQIKQIYIIGNTEFYNKYIQNGQIYNSENFTIYRANDTSIIYKQFDRFY